ncbi:hypothetical protein [Candidatus Albibeggiatoa sp. nov. BB20]|uniref:InlB B-repeat-containing protein n=1 Tax=Candidatus Albibeggiatoa sp. nov. BB20 TaxID=3162723 RepID=UPI0033659D57
MARNRFAIFICFILNLFLINQANAVPWDFEESVPILAKNYPQMPEGVSIFSFTVSFDPSAGVRRDFSGGESYLVHIPLPPGVNGVQAAFQSNFADPLSGIGFYGDTKPDLCPANVTNGSTPCGSGNYVYFDDGEGNRFEPVKGQASIGIYDLRFESGSIQTATTGYLGLYLQPGSTSRYDSSAIGFSISIGDRDLYEQWWCENISRQCTTTPETPNNLTLSLAAVGNGAISVRNGSTELGQCSQNSGTCIYTQAQGTTLGLVALPTNSGTTVAWSGNSGQCNANNGTVQSVSLSSNVSCNVQFTEQTVVEEKFNLNIIPSSGGTVTSTDGLIQCGSDTGRLCLASYVTGQQVVLQANANTGFRFTGWTGNCSGTSSTFSLTMNQVASCEANFATQTTQNTAPVAQFAHWFDSETSTVYLDASASYDDDNDNLIYQWHSSNKQTDFVNTTQKTEIEFSNNTSTTQTITLIVTDGQGGFDSTAQVIELPRPITADFSLSYTGGQQISTTSINPNVYFASGNLNVDLNSTATSSDNIPITSYQWSISNYAVLDTNQSNLTISLQNKDFLYAITLLVTDQNGRSSSISKLLQVTADSQSPIISNVVVQPTGTIENQIGLLAAKIDAGSTYDPDGGNLTYNWSSTGTCNNGQACTATEAQAYFSYDAEGTYDVSLTVIDEESHTATIQNQQIEVKRPIASGLSVAPLAYDAAKNYYVATYGEPLTVQVSAQSGVTQGTIRKYTWSYKLNNGAKTVISDTVNPSITFSPTQAGEYVFLVDIEDNYNLLGGSGSGQIHVDLPAVGTGRSLKTRSNGLSSGNARFSGSVIDTENNVLLGNQNITLKDSDPVKVQFTIDVAAEDVGQAADIVSVIEFKPTEIQQDQWYMQSQTETLPYVEWNSEQDTASFTFNKAIDELKLQEQVIVAEGQFTGLIGNFKIFTGYCLKIETGEAGELTFNETPLQFIVEE